MTRFAMDDAYPTERDEARTLVKTCADCAALSADIRAISASIARLPDAKRTRDFAITAEQAEKLRGTRLSRWLGSLATPRFGVLRPVAGVALSIGLVMAVVGTGMPGMLPAAGTDPQRESLNNQAGAATPPPAPAAGATPAAAPAEGSDVGPVAAPEASPRNGAPDYLAESFAPMIDRVYVEDARTDSFDGESLDIAPASNATRDILVYAGLAIAVLSLGLLILAWLARRYFADPLLR